MIDYHIHTTFSDGRSSHEDYIEAAVEKKLDEIGFSDHVCLREVDWAMKLSDAPAMVKKVTNLKKESRISVKLGVEMDFFPGMEDKINEFTRKYPFDYVIGSVHHIGGWTFDDSRQAHGYDLWDIDDLYKLYFSLVQKAAKSGLFNILGHPDVVKKFGHKPERSIYNLLNEAASVLRDNNVCIELNSSGLIKPCKEIYPSRQFLEICHSKGVQITFGSDAHSSERIAGDFDQVIKLAKDVGYEKIASFTGRKRDLVKI